MGGSPGRLVRKERPEREQKVVIQTMGGSSRITMGGVSQMDFREIRSHVMVFISMVVMAYSAKDPGNERFGSSAFQRMSKL